MVSKGQTAKLHAGLLVEAKSVKFVILHQSLGQKAGPAIGECQALLRSKAERP